MKQASLLFLLLLVVAVLLVQSFTRLSPRAPVNQYFEPNVSEEIDGALDRLFTKSGDPDICGGSATLEEELLVWKRGEPRPVSPSKTYIQEVAWGCQYDVNDDPMVRDLMLPYVRTGGEIEAQYTIIANIAWNIDRGIEAQLEGKVVDQRGSPIEGAKIRVHGLERDYSAFRKTDAQGFYSLELPSDIYEVRLEREGCEPKAIVAPVCAFGPAQGGGPGLPAGVRERATGERRARGLDAGERRVTLLDFQTACTDYYIQDTDQRTVSSSIGGVDQTAKETWVFTGKPVRSPAHNRLGWQTLWEVEGGFTSEFSTSAQTATLMGGVMQCIPPHLECAGKTRDTIRITFDAEPLTQVGDRFTITSVRSGVYRQEWLQCNSPTLTCTSPLGQTVTLPTPPEGITETQSPTFTHEAEVVAFRGEEGATIAMRVEGVEKPYIVQIRRGRKPEG